MSHRRLLAVALSGLLGLTALTGSALAQASPDPKTVQPGAYKVEPNHTQIGFTLLHLGFTYYSGVFSNASGSLTLDPAKPAAAALNVTVPIDSVQTTSQKLNDELKGDQWFDAAKFPTATFVSTHITLTGHGKAKIDGNLTLHGVTKPVQLDAKFIGAGVNPVDKAYTVGFQGTTTIKRGDFGVKAYLPMLGDDVRLTIAAAFEHEAK